LQQGDETDDQADAVACPTTWVAGDFIYGDLGPGEHLTISTGSLAAFGSGTDYDIVGVGGCLKILFGHEGIFMTRMTGPGRVLLQTQKRVLAARHHGA
jgi:uncharacterized protein (AIM24 family)